MFNLKQIWILTQSILEVVPCQYQHWLLRTNEIIEKTFSRGTNLYDLRVGRDIIHNRCAKCYSHYEQKKTLSAPKRFLYQWSTIFNKQMKMQNKYESARKIRLD